MSQRGKVEKYISSVFPNTPNIDWVNTIGLFKDLEKQHDFGKFGLTATAINADAANDFKTEEAKAVSITEPASRESETGDDGNTIQAFLNIATNSKVYIPGLASGWANEWGRVTDAEVNATNALFHGAAPTGENVLPNNSNRGQKYDNPWIHKCYFKFLNASSEEKYWRITAVYSKNLHPIRRARKKALQKGQKGSPAWVKYKLFSARMDLNSYKHVLKGINLLRALEIPNHSMCVRDMEGGAGAFFKAIRGRNPTIVVGPNTGDTYDDTRDLMRMYSYADCVTDSDPNKSKVYCDNFGIFNTDSQVIISAITNKKQITVKAHNPQLRMKFNITHTTGGGPQKSWKTYSNTAKQISAGKNGNVNLRIGKVKQVWSQPSTIPSPKAALNPSVFIIPNAPEDNEAAEIVNSWQQARHYPPPHPPIPRATIEQLYKGIKKNEAIDNLKKFLRQRGQNFAQNLGLNELKQKALNLTGWHLFSEILNTSSDSRLSPISLQSAAYGLQRKQGGDRFQGWQVRNLKNITSPVVEHCWNFDGQNPPTPMPQTQNAQGTLYYGSQPNLQSIWARGQGDAFVITGDIPFLCWCLRNDVNVLFGSLGDERTPENPKFVYFRVQDN